MFDSTQYSKQYHAAHKAAINARKRAHYAPNRDRILARQQKQRAANPLRDIWYSMNYRCSPDQPDSENRRNYFERGIRVCRRWHRSNPRGYQNFEADLGQRPAAMSLDRIDNDGDYSTSNCKWSSPKQQRANRRDSIR